MYSRGNYGGRSGQMGKAATPPPPDNPRLMVSTDLNTISSFQQIRDWISELVQEKDIKMKQSDIENRALGAWHHWQSAWKANSTNAVEFEWDPQRNAVVAL